MKSILEKNKKYYAKNPAYNSVIHFIMGVGAGFLLTYPMAGSHPVRWGAAFVTIALAGMVMAGKW